MKRSGWRYGEKIGDHCEMELVVMGNNATCKLCANVLDVEGAPPVVVHDINADDVVVYGNVAACRHFGVDLAGLLALHLKDFDPIMDPVRMASLRGLVQTHGFCRFETLHRRGPGKLVPVDVLMAAMTSQGKNLLVSYIFDITERKVAEERLQHYQLEAALHEQDRRYQELFASFEDSILFIEVGQDWRYTLGSFNPLAQHLFGSAGIALVSGDTLDVLPSQIVGVVSTAERSLLVAGIALHQELMCVLNGLARHFATSLIPMLTEEGAVYRLALVLRDITTSKTLAESLAASERAYRELVENSPDTIARYNRDCQRTYVNAAFANRVSGGYAALLGTKPTDSPGGESAVLFEHKIRAVFATGVNLEYEFIWPDRDGKASCSLVRLAAERDAGGEIVSVLSVGRDITELTTYRQRIHHMAYYDQLTDLPNRVLFSERLQHLLQDAEHYNRIFAVMMIDVDRFKFINDTMGHPAGDIMLREVALRLRDAVRRDDVVARLGGDEFAVLLPGIANHSDPEQVAAKLLDALRRPVLIDGKEIVASLSIGIALFPLDSRQADDLLKYADTAMYLAKRSGRNNFKFYLPGLTDNVIAEMQQQSELR